MSTIFERAVPGLNLCIFPTYERARDVFRRCIDQRPTREWYGVFTATTMWRDSLQVGVADTQVLFVSAGYDEAVRRLVGYRPGFAYFADGIDSHVWHQLNANFRRGPQYTEFDAGCGARRRRVDPEDPFAFLLEPQELVLDLLAEPDKVLTSSR